MTLAIDRLQSDTSKWISMFLRWVIPIHILGSLITLESTEAFDLRTPWIALTFLASVTLLALSVPKHWKPFLFSGLVGIAIAYKQLATFVEQASESSEVILPQGLRWLAAGHYLTLIAFVTGAFILITAWRWHNSTLSITIKRWLNLHDKSRKSRSPDDRNSISNHH
jgi:hypothetical protein